MERRAADPAEHNRIGSPRLPEPDLHRQLDLPNFTPSPVFVEWKVPPYVSAVVELSS